jgi:hypothetical protein
MAVERMVWTLGSMVGDYCYCRGEVGAEIYGRGKERNESTREREEREEDTCLLTILRPTGLDDKAIEDKIATLVREGAK